MMDEAGKRKRDERIEVSLDSLVSPNFEELARRFPSFGIAYRNVQQSQQERGGNFAANITQEFSIALTQALLNVHWGIKLAKVPVDQLCPPVPNRYFFVHWLQKEVLPLLISPRFFEQPRTQLSYTGLDIGTGATCIYPLLFVSSSDQPYSMYATEIDPVSVQFALENVKANKLEHRIMVLPVEKSSAQNDQEGEMQMEDESGPLRNSWKELNAPLPLDFCMTNPPFYETDEDYKSHREGDGRIRTAMTSHEGTYPGGEVGFITDMIVDGLYLWKQGVAPGWSSTMCGKKSTFTLIKNILNQLLGHSHVLSSEFGPSHMTRWFIAWAYDKPALKSPFTESISFAFDVDLNDIDQSQDPSTVVCSRFVDFCQERKDHFACEILRRLKGACTLEVRDLSVEPDTVGDESLPSKIQGALHGVIDPNQRWSSFVPAHFALTVQINHHSVQLKGFSHTPCGKRRLVKLQQSLPGEISRTNRAWRRKLNLQAIGNGS